MALATGCIDLRRPDCKPAAESRPKQNPIGSIGCRRAPYGRYCHLRFEGCGPQRLIEKNLMKAMRGGALLLSLAFVTAARFAAADEFAEA
ncbi:MAG: hypothetical protein WEC41_05640, partial [Dongiaceae bacterium]